MEKDVVLKLWEAQEKMREDLEYQNLFAEWDDRNKRFMGVLDDLNTETQKEILDYLGYLLELHFKTAEYLVK